VSENTIDKPIGKWGEDIACSYLTNKGMEIICRNWQCRAGEIDLVCFDKDELVFVEVKSRQDSKSARKHLLDNVSYTKKKRLRLLSEIYLAKHYSRKKHPPLRIDVVGVLLDKSTREIRYIEHIIAAVGVDL
jgi:putative endonuclease